MITRKYNIRGMTCGGCAVKIEKELSAYPGVAHASVDKASDTAVVKSVKELPISDLRKTIKALDAKYDLSRYDDVTILISDEKSRSWWDTYRPILLIFFYLLGVTILSEYGRDGWDMMRMMRHFMAGFFLIFSFFKLLDIKGFADSYRMYDVVAGIWPGWGYVYPFVELGLGIAYLTNYDMLNINVVAFVVMSVSLVGVLRSVLNKKKIQCACLGAVFDLPMSTVTIIEDALMIVMSGWMILRYLY